MNGKEFPLINDQMILGGYRVIKKLDVRSNNSLYIVENESNIANAENVDEEQHSYDNKYQIMKAIPYQTSDEKCYADQEINIVNFLRYNKSFVTYDETFEEEIEVEFMDGSKKCKCQKNYMFAIMKFYIHNDLEKEVSKCRKGMCEEVIIDILYQVLKALKFLKDNGIVHHDIKLANILIIDVEPLTIALTDFEFAEVLNAGQNTDSDWGTPIYMAPEILMNKEHRMEVDMWALGVCAYRLASRTYPFNLIPKDTYDKVCKKINDNKLSFATCYFKNKSQQLINLISKMLNKDQNERITVDEALQDQLFERYWSNEQ